jgi:intracellular sulfur oxidation DsrE/DsrF family protein
MVNMMLRFFSVLILSLLSVSATWSQDTKFQKSGYIEGYGPYVRVEADWNYPKDTQFKVAFDLAKATEPGSVNKTIMAATRFINMHVDAGVDPADIKIAIVVHGSGGADLANDAYYEANNVLSNGNAPLIAALMSKGVEFIVCGQSAAFYGMSKADFLPGVQLALSAMTAHAVLQQQGYTLNPF